MLEKALRYLSISTVFLIPNYQSPNKKSSLLSEKQRYSLLKKMIPHLPQVKEKPCVYKCIDFEIKKKKESFTIDTLNYLIHKDDNRQYILLIGSDNFFLFHTWKNYEAILKKVTLCIIRRDDYLISKYKRYISKYLHYQDLSSIVILGKDPVIKSSTQLKKDIKENKDIVDSVPELIYKELQKLRDIFQ